MTKLRSAIVQFVSDLIGMLILLILFAALVARKAVRA